MSKIELELLDHSALQVAYGICKYFNSKNGIKELALIDLEEVAEHINAYVKAEKRALEVINNDK